MAPSNQLTLQIEAAETFLLVVLAERTGPLTVLQREFLTSTLARVREAETLLRVETADAATDWESSRSVA